MSLRRCLHVFLMLLIVMPSMACFKSICAAGAMAHSPMPCCHDMAGKTMGLKLIKDCLNNDLAQVVAAKMPVPDGALLFLGLAAFTLWVMPFARRGGALRFARPPPDPYSSPFSILLATQRFRN